jgi:hypothetical protein
MSKPLMIYGISAPGFFGLNTQDSPLTLVSGFASIATNCVIDQFGRIGSRKGWSRVNSSSGNLGANNIGVIHELVQVDGTLTVLFAGNNKLFKLDGTNAVVELTYGGGGTAPTITASNWQCASLNGITYFFQLGHTPLIYDPAVSTTTYRRVSEKTGYAGTVPSGNIVVSAFGRLWVAETSSDNVTITFSDLLAGHVWTGGTSGTLDVSRVWPNGADQIMGLAAHNNYFFVFGKRQILVYQGATTPSTMSLADTIAEIGCLSRDSIATTGTDIIFLSNSGVRSLLRTIQEKSAPLRDLSKNVRNDLMTNVSSEVLANIKAVYSESNGFYLLNLPVTKVTYVFDTKAQLQDGSARVTTWDSIEPTSLYSRRNGDLLIGKNGYVGKYGTYLDHATTYRMQYFTNYANLNETEVTSVLKRISVVVIGGSNQGFIIKWGYDFSGQYYSATLDIPVTTVAEYGTAEYGANGVPVAYYSAGIQLSTLTAPASGFGNVVQTGYEVQINGSPISIQKIEIQAKDGKTV